jgi:hypothetical protein
MDVNPASPSAPPTLHNGVTAYMKAGEREMNRTTILDQAAVLS